MATKYSSRRYDLSLSEIESQALNDVLHDIEEYVTDDSKFLDDLVWVEE